MHRYRVILYHQNEPWVSKVEAALDMPLFHFSHTDSHVVLEQHLTAEKVDILLTGLKTKHLSFRDREADHSIGFKHNPLWKELLMSEHSCDIIVLCQRNELVEASGLAFEGSIEDYVLVNPILDNDRIFFSVLRVLERRMLREKFEQLTTHKLTAELLESIEILKSSMYEEEAPVVEELEAKPLVENTVEEEPVEKEALVDDGLPKKQEPDRTSLDLLPKKKETGRTSLDMDEPMLMKKKAVLDDEIEARGGLIMLFGQDSQAFRLIADTLYGEGYTVVFAKQAEDAMMHLSSDDFEMVLIHPSQVTIQFVREMRQVGPQSDLPVVTLWVEQHEQIMQLLGPGSNHLLPQSLSPTSIIGTINSVLDERYARGKRTLMP